MKKRMHSWFRVQRSRKQRTMLDLEMNRGRQLRQVPVGRRIDSDDHPFRMNNLEACWSLSNRSHAQWISSAPESSVFQLAQSNSMRMNMCRRGDSHPWFLVEVPCCTWSHSSEDRAFETSSFRNYVSFRRPNLPIPLTDGIANYG